MGVLEIIAIIVFPLSLSSFMLQANLSRVPLLHRPLIWSETLGTLVFAVSLPLMIASGVILGLHSWVLLVALFAGTALVYPLFGRYLVLRLWGRLAMLLERRIERSERKKEGEAMSFCPHCGKEVSEGFKFCPECGESVKRESTPEETERTLARQSPNGARPMRWQDRLEIWLKRWFWLAITIVPVSYFIWFYSKSKVTLFLWLIIPIVAVGLLFTWFSRKS